MSDLERFSGMLNVSVYNDEGITYRLPDQAHSEESSSWRQPHTTASGCLRTSQQTTANVNAATVRPARSHAAGSELRSGRAASMLYVEAVTTRCERLW